MCQVLMLTSTKKIKNLKKTTETIAAALQETQKDGFGYSIVGKNGVFGERTTNTTFLSRLGLERLEVALKIIEPTYNKHGLKSECLGAGIFHGRTSTNHNTLVNTHPINNHGWSLIHNGVVTNHGPDYAKTTTNDTEDILHHLVTGGIESVEKYVSGYYAVGAIDPIGNLHVIKDSTARLYVAMNKTLECLVFGTTEDLITDIADSLKWDIGPIDTVKNDLYMIFDLNGSLVSSQSIKPLGYTSKESDYAEYSLGHKLGNRQSEVLGLKLDSKEYKYDFKDSDYNYDLYGSSNSAMTDRDSYEAYQEEIDNLDASYTFFDWLGRSITLEDFRKLDEVTKLDCKVIRGDGTVVDPADYFTDKIA